MSKTTIEELNEITQHINDNVKEFEDNNNITLPKTDKTISSDERADIIDATLTNMLKMADNPGNEGLGDLVSRMAETNKLLRDAANKFKEDTINE